MGALRHFLLARRWVALAVIVIALAIKALVPAGFMLETRGHVLTVAVCADASGGHAATRQIAVPGKPDANAAAQAKSGEGCAFSALSFAALSGANPELLALALAFILLLGIRAATVLRVAPARRIRPPLRAPPAFV
ncbi:MAG: DUF2946 domain-containing protein [Novosphingobium sp.]